MNNSKRIKTKKKNENEGYVKKQERVVSSKILTISSAIFLIVLVGALLFDQLYETTYLTIDKEKYKLHDLSYYFHTVEYQYDYYDQMFGGQYWDMSYDENSGATMRDVAKQEAIDSAIYSEVLYNEAVDSGYSLTEEEKTTVDTSVTSLLNGQLTKEVIEKNNFTKAYLTEFFRKSTLADRYRKDKINSFAIDDEAIKAGISADEYKQYDVEYLYIPTQSTDEAGNAVEFTAEEKTAAFDKINKAYESAKTSKDWSKLVAEDEEQLQYQETSFIASDETFDEKLEAEIMKMNIGDITDIYEAETGYYVVKMKDNKSTESYDNAVAEAISKAENDAFAKFYTETILPKHSYKANEGAINSLVMGEITLPQ